MTKGGHCFRVALYLFSKKKKKTILTIYVDDIIIANNDPEERVKLEKHLMGQFDIKNLGQMTYFWGLK